MSQEDDNDDIGQVTDYNDYFNIDDIIAEQELIPVSFQTDVHFVDQFFASQIPLYVNQSQSQSQQEFSPFPFEPSPNRDDIFDEEQQSDQNSQKTTQIKKNSRMELPLWLVIVLAQYGHVSVLIPKCYKSLEQLNAEPTTCNVRALSNYFFINGAHVAELLVERGYNDKIKEFAKNMNRDLTIAFKKRFLKILNESQNIASKSNYSEIIRRLTAAELLIFEAGREGIEEFIGYKQTSGYENLNSSSKASLWDMSSSSDSFNARDFYNRTKQLEEEYKLQGKNLENHRKRTLLSDGTIVGTY